ncbi:MAG: hypothetical protein KatS3mg105_0909 [Gemmatales bacterium]|nr:MAG: hypothetical protein KatS3mg105_0909 [Gemmatales bacterium]
MRSSTEYRNTKTSPELRNSEQQAFPEKVREGFLLLPFYTGLIWLCRQRTCSLFTFRPAWIVLAALLVVGVWAALAGSSPQTTPSKAEISLLDDLPLPNLNTTSAEPCPQPTGETPPAETPAQAPTALPPEISEDSRPTTGPELSPPEAEVPEEPIRPVIAVEPTRDRFIAVRLTHRGDTPMIHNWKSLGLQALLAGALASAPTLSAPPTKAEPNADEVIAKQLKELKDSIDALKKQVQGLQTGMADTDIRIKKLEGQIADLEKDAKAVTDLTIVVQNLSKQVADLNKRISSAPPAVVSKKPMGRILLVNDFPEEMTVVVNNKAYRLAPNSIHTIDNVPAGIFTYEVLRVQPVRNRELGDNETFTIRIHQ